MAKFQEGDYVRKTMGKRIAVVTGFHGATQMHVKYLHNNTHAYYEYQSNFVKVDKDAFNEKGELLTMPATNKLYEINYAGEAARIATKLMEKSPTSWIMEVKGTNEVLVVPAANCKEIIPYTIKVVYTSGTVSHYHADPGQYEKGDIYLVTTSGKPELAQIVEVDSKGVSNKEFKHSGKLVVEK